MNYQEVYDKVRKHLLNQNNKAIDSSTSKCVYLDHETGNKCAIGCLIPEGKYKPEFEGCSPSFILQDFEEFDDIKGYFLDGLQAIHDKIKPERWEFRLNEFAEQNNLEVHEG